VLSPIAEEAAYARCHGERGPDLIRVVRAEPKRAQYRFPSSGETLRAAFESRLDSRAHHRA
jgi:hypothetical protein